MASVKDTPELIVADAAAWRAWLLEHHDTSEGVFLVLAKKGVTEPTNLTWDTSLDEALCFGWIDGQRNKRDDTTFSQRFTPRRRTSPWSERNVGHIARLTEAGRMHPAGLAEVEKAQADGRWEKAYKGPATATPPADLVAALAAEPKAQAMFEKLTSQNRFAVIYRVEGAKRADTRERRIATFVEQLARGETIYPQKRTVND